MSLVYTNIQHSFRKRHRLTCNEYVLADMIYFLCTRPNSRVPGWAYKSRVSMAEDLGISKQSVLNLVKTLEEKELIEKNPVSAFLRTTEKWNEVYFTGGKDSLPLGGKDSYSTGKDSLPHAGKESLPYNNTLDNNIDNEYSSSKSDDLGEINNSSNTVKPLKQKKEARIGEFSREESVEIFNHIKSYFLDFYKTQERTEYYFEAKDASKIYSLARKVLFKMLEGGVSTVISSEGVWENTNFFIKAAHATGDNFIKGNFSLSTLDSKFNDIYSKLKAGKHGNQPKQNVNDAIRQEARSAFGERTFTKTA